MLQCTKLAWTTTWQSLHARSWRTIVPSRSWPFTMQLLCACRRRRRLGGSALRQSGCLCPSSGLPVAAAGRGAARPAARRRAQQQRPHVPQRAAIRIRVRRCRQLHHGVSRVARGRSTRRSQQELWVILAKIFTTENQKEVLFLIFKIKCNWVHSWCSSINAFNIRGNHCPRSTVLGVQYCLKPEENTGKKIFGRPVWLFFAVKVWWMCWPGWWNSFLCVLKDNIGSIFSCQMSDWYWVLYEKYPHTEKLSRKSIMRKWPPRQNLWQFFIISRLMRNHPGKMFNEMFISGKYTKLFDLNH